MRRVFNLVDTHSTAQSPSNNVALATDIDAIQNAWAEALRCDFGRIRDAMLCRLAETTQELVHLYPNDPKVLLWNGIVLTGYAKSLGGLCSLQFQALAKKSLEQSISLAPHDGASYLYLGLLYDQAPAAPYGFGDEQMAKSFLEQGLSLTLNAAGSRPTLASKRA